MPRRKRDDAVAERAHQLLAEQGQRRREGAEKAAQTRRKGRGSAEARDQDQAEPKRATRGKRERKERKPRVHGDMLTVAIRGPLAAKMRQLSESTGLSLAKLLQDAILVYGGQVEAGSEPGTALARWNAQQ